MSNKKHNISTRTTFLYYMKSTISDLKVTKITIKNLNLGQTGFFMNRINVDNNFMYFV